MPHRREIRGKMKHISALLFIFAFVIVFSGCTAPVPETGGSIQAAVTVLPQAEMVKAVGGDRVDVIVIVPPGVEPHTYEPSAGTLIALEKTDVYFKIGNGLMPFEDKLTEKVVALNPDILIVDTSEGVALIHGSDPDSPAGNDPHIWLSPANARIMVENIAGGMARIDPDHAAYYEGNARLYIAKIDVLDEMIQKELNTSPVRTIVVTHPAWSYFARDYGIEQVSIESEGKEPTARDIEAVVTLARQRNISVVFVEPQYSPRSAEVIAEEINGSIVTIDPLAGDYLDNLARVAELFAGKYR
jgi:zinc transport system substrate-binding protein